MPFWPFGGKQPPKPDTKNSEAELREQVRLLRLDVEAREVRHRDDLNQLKESFPGGWSPSYPGFGQLVNPIQAYYDGLTPLFSAVPAYWDYTLNLGFYVIEAYLDILRMSSRMWYSTHGQAKGVIEGLRDYVVHTGYDYQVIKAKHADEDGQLIKRVQRLIDEFLTKNNWYERELDGYVRLHRDGESPSRLIPQGDGVTKIRTVEPWMIRCPGKVEPDSLFGVITEPGDLEQIKSYYVTYTGTLGDGNHVSADRMVMMKTNTDFAVKRGVSDFLATQGLWEMGRKLLACGLTGEAARQCIAWIEQYNGAPAAAVKGLADALTDTPGGTPVASPGNPPPLPVESLESGTKLRIDKSQEFKNGPIGNAENAKIMLTAAYQALSVYYRVPEWMISGFSDANFAQALVQESPLVRRCQTEQKLIMEHHKDILRLVVKIGIEQGLLPDDALDQIDFNIEATPLVVRDALKETQRHEILAKNGLESKRGWAIAEDLDYDAEKANMEKDGDEPPMELGVEANHKPGGPSDTPGAVYKQETGQTS